MEELLKIGNINDFDNVLLELKHIKSQYKEVKSDSVFDKSMIERMDGGISALDKAIDIIEKHLNKK